MKNILNGLKVGLSKVNVFRKDIDERTGRETITKIHSGIVLSVGSAFARVFNPAPVSQGGDISPELSQSYPFESKRMWLESAGELKTPMKIPVAFAL